MNETIFFLRCTLTNSNDRMSTRYDTKTVLKQATANRDSPAALPFDEFQYFIPKRIRLCLAHTIHVGFTKRKHRHKRRPKSLYILFDTKNHLKKKMFGNRYKFQFTLFLMRPEQILSDFSI